MRIYTARQPIFSRKKNVVAYELLFRKSEANAFPVGMDEDVATSRLLVNTMFNMDINEITEGLPALVNFPQKMLELDLQWIMPTNKIIVEVLETVCPTMANLKLFKKLREKGYFLALDDFEYNSDWDKFFPYVRLIKIDIQQSNEDQIVEIAKHAKKHKIKLLAEKVETYEEYKLCYALGFHFFQGYFFCKPEMIHSNGLDVSSVAVLSVHAELSKSEPNINKIVGCISIDSNLSYKLVKCVSNVSVKEISSIHQAVKFIGLKELKLMMELLIKTDLNKGKPEELSKVSIIRSRFCELLAANSKYKNIKDEAIVVGLFSTLEASLDREMNQILENLPLNKRIKDALMRDNSNELSYILMLCKSYERAEWDMVDLYARNIGISKNDIKKSYLESIEWFKKVQEAFIKLPAIA